MKNTLYLLMLLAGVLAGCNNPERESITGAYTYTVLENGSGPEIEDGQYMITHVKAIDNNDSTWFDRDPKTMPMTLVKDSAAWANGEGGIYEIFYYAKKGDSLRITLTVEEFFTKTVGIPVPPEAMGVSTVDLYWKVVEVLNYDDYFAYMRTVVEEQEKVWTEEEKAQIATYLDELNWESELSPEGVHVIIHEPGEGANAASGQTITVNYAGYLLDGTLFDTSIADVAKENGVFSENRPYSPYSFTIDQSSVITGWHEGFKLLNKGARASLIIPSRLGYGPQGSPPGIPGNSTLRFDVEIVEIN